MNPEQEPPTLSRREFGRRAATVVAAAIATPLMAHAASADPSSSSTPNPELPEPEVQEPRVDAKLAEVVRRYGDRLSEAERSRLRDIIRDNEATLKRVHRFPLDNSDAPATGLRLYPDDTVPKRRE